MFVMLTFVSFSGISFGQEKKEETIKIKTSAVCGMCKDRIESNMAYEKGVKDVVLNVKTKICTITYKTAKTDPQKLRTAITKIGYDADDMKADENAYDKLPACCKKDNETH